MAKGESASQRLTELATEPVGRLLWRYSIPAVVGIVVMQLYNIVDRIFIGHVVGDVAIAGLTITFPVTNIATALGILVGAGASARVSIALGAKNIRLAQIITGNSLVLTLLIGAVYLTLFAVFINPILTLFGARPDTLPYARDMMLYVLPGLLITNVTFSFNNIMRASGFPVKAMITMLIGAAVNIALAPLFIYVFGWGIKGAAIATDIAMAVSCVFVMRHFVKPHGEIFFKRGIYRLRMDVIKAIFSIGAAPCLISVASCFINVLINNSLLKYGGQDSGTIASAGVFVTFTALICSVVIGICQGMQPIVGYNYGAGLRHRLRRTYMLTVGVSTIVCVLGFLGGEFIPAPISSTLLNNPELISSTARYLQICMLAFWMVGFQIVSTNFLQSIGKAGQSIFLSLTRQVLFIIPLLLLMPRFFGLDGIWMSFPAADVWASAVTLVMVWRCFRRL